MRVCQSIGRHFMGARGLGAGVSECDSWEVVVPELVFEQDL